MTASQATTPPPTAGLLLAAGAGRRLGGRPKALLEYDGTPLVERAAGLLREGGCAAVHVVLGAAREEVARRARLTGCVRVDHPGWEAGMGSSLRVGLDSLRRTAARAALVMLVDQPGIGAEVVARVLAAHAAGAPLVTATYDGERGHPVLLARHHWEGAAATAHGDRGARDHLRRHRAALTLVECGDIAVPRDIDTPADLHLLTSHRPAG